MRDQVVIATKFGVHHNPDKTLSVDSRPEAIRRAIDGSLSRLGIDCIDLYYQHRTDPNVEPEEVAGFMAELMQAGKIRAWGISEADEDYLRRADAVCPVAAVQNRSCSRAGTSRSFPCSRSSMWRSWRSAPWRTAF